MHPRFFVDCEGFFCSVSAIHSRGSDETGILTVFWSIALLLLRGVFILLRNIECVVAICVKVEDGVPDAN